MFLCFYAFSPPGLIALIFIDPEEGWLSVNPLLLLLLLLAVSHSLRHIFIWEPPATTTTALLAAARGQVSCFCLPVLPGSGSLRFFPPLSLFPFKAGRRQRHVGFNGLHINTGSSGVRDREKRGEKKEGRRGTHETKTQEGNLRRWN